MTVNRTVLILLGASALLGATSYTVTDVQQKGRIQYLHDSRRAAELATARAEELIAQESVSAEAAEAALSRWHSRYKYIPRAMDTADIVEYLESLTRTGFEAFDLKLAGRTDTPDVGAYTFEVKGEGEYAALYHLVWHLDNNREFYRISDLRMEHVESDPETGRRRDLVKFSFGLKAFFGGVDAISAPEADLAPIPVGLLLPTTTSTDIFRPLIRVPRDAPSTRVDGPEIGVPAAAAGPASAPPAAAAVDAPRAAEARPAAVSELDRASLLLVVGDQAVFDVGGTQVTARVGEAVLGGVLASVDPDRGGVRIRTEEGGRVRLVSLRLGEAPEKR